MKFFGGEDSDVDEETSDSESSEGEGDRSDEESNSEEESEEENEEDDWVVGAIDVRRLNLTGDQGLCVQLPENPSFSDFFHLPFPDNLFDKIKSQTN